MGSTSTPKSSKRRQSDAVAPAADVVIDKKDKKEKKDKKDKEEKKDKKDKKDKKRKSVSADDVEDVSMMDVDVPAAEEVKEKKEKSKKREAEKDEDEDVEMGDAKAEKKSKKNKTGKAADQDVVRYLVPFAEPLATEEETAKVFEAIRRASRNRALHTGIKETQKALRKIVQSKSKSATTTSSSSSSSSSPSDSRGVVILAGDTYPWDIITHMPILCEDAGVDLIYVRSREQLGRASGSNRMQTSAMMVLPTKGVKKAGSAKKDEKSEKGEKDKKKKGDGEVSEEEYKKAYEKFAKLVSKANERVKI